MTTTNYEEITRPDGRHAGCVVYSTRHDRWATAWNGVPWEGEDPSSYVFKTRAEAIAFLPVRYPANGPALSTTQVHAILKARGRL